MVHGFVLRTCALEACASIKMQSHRENTRDVKLVDVTYSSACRTLEDGLGSRRTDEVDC